MGWIIFCVLHSTIKVHLTAAGLCLLSFVSGGSLGLGHRQSRSLSDRCLFARSLARVCLLTSLRLDPLGMRVSEGALHSVDVLFKCLLLARGASGNWCLILGCWLRGHVYGLRRVVYKPLSIGTFQADCSSHDGICDTPLANSSESAVSLWQVLARRAIFVHSWILRLLGNACERCPESISSTGMASGDHRFRVVESEVGGGGSWKTEGVTCQAPKGRTQGTLLG